ncbi:uncharacterized protein LOC143035269 [Oratosquilla oratoria]|uniref:uncharacterized protein LOC143035269 n=1 Tax=Oratosquilla oratoria TaxID=337810 RepID=UPI003F76EA8E
MKERNWDILGIAETRLKGKNGRKVIHDNYLLLYQGDDDGRHGVAIVLSPDVSNNIERIEYVNNRIISVSLKTKYCSLDITQVYAPQQGLNLEEKERFYEELQDTIDRMPNRDNSLIIGDLNGYVGLRRENRRSGKGGGFSIGDISKDGNRIIDFCVRNNMSIMNTFFKHQETHKWTWYRWNHIQEEYTQKSMIDLVLSSRKSLIHDVKSIPSLSLDSDHRAVVAKVNITIPPHCRRLKRKRIEVEKLKDQRVREELEDKLAEITITGETIEQQWKIAQSQINNIAEEVVGVKWTGGCKKKRTAYWNEEVQEAVREKNKKGNGEYNYSIKDSQGNLLTEPEEIDRRWKEYFSSLLNIEEDNERTDEEQTNGVWVDEEEGINESKVNKTLAKIKNNKACGIDNIPGEISKYGGGIALSLLTELLSKAWNTGEVPNDRSTALICPVFKKGDHAECSNYRYLEKAFDRVPRDKLWSVLQSAEYQIPPKLRRAIKSLYNSNNTAVKPFMIKEVQFRRGERDPIESLEFAYADDILNIESFSHAASESLNLQYGTRYSQSTD